MTTSIASRRFWRKNGVWPLPVLKAVFSKVGLCAMLTFVFIGAPLLTYAALGSVGGLRLVSTWTLLIFCVILAWCIFSDIRMYALLRPKGFRNNVYMFFCGRYIVRARSLYRYRIFARVRDYSVLGIFGNAVFMPLFHLYVISWMYILWFIVYAISETAALGVLNEALEFARPVIEFFSFIYLVDFLSSQQYSLDSKILLLSYIYYIISMLFSIVVLVIFSNHMDIINNNGFSQKVILNFRKYRQILKLSFFLLLVAAFSILLTFLLINADEIKTFRRGRIEIDITETHYYVFGTGARFCFYSNSIYFVYLWVMRWFGYIILFFDASEFANGGADRREV